MLRLYLCKGFNNLLEQDDKGDVSAETTGPAPAEVSAGTQILAERLAEIILIQSRALLSFLLCLGRESRQMSVSRQMSFLLVSRSFHSELLQYNFLPLVPVAFEFCQCRSIPGSLPEITNKLATDTPNGVKIVLNHRASRHLSKTILEKVVNPTRKDWSLRLDDAYRKVYKTLVAVK
ncbi:hypothetical protein V6N11_033897 [Hibiscus sabdariffa]|uniref:Uncharacterized protein n=1 Tax=Hibiscus sabdariffa TaxID=183260 RepID=A0ABR2S0V8_9ROSI